MNITILDSGKFGIATEEDVAEFEKQLKTSLPADYRQFLLTHNGGMPEASVFRINYELGEGIVNDFFGLHDGPNYASLRWHQEISRGRMPDILLPIGGDPGGNLICISLGTEDKGAIYFWEHEFEGDEGEEPIFDNVYRIADSFSQFLNELTPEPDEEFEDELEEACSKGNLDVVKAFLAAGGDVNRTNQYGHSLIQTAAARGQLAVVRLLVELGASISKALTFAAQNGNTDVVQYLLSKGADVDEVINDRSDTPLMSASAFGHEDVVKVLLSHGANVNARNKYGQTAAEQASWAEQKDVIELLKNAGGKV